MHLGNVSKLFYDKGYGSIRTKDGEDVHFHKQCLWDCRFEELYESQEVELQMQMTGHGYLGFEIRPYTRQVKRS